MRRAVVKIHRWIGIVLFAYVAMICLTGSVLVYRPELFRHFEPQPLEVAAGSVLLSDQQLLASARRAFPDELPAQVWRGREPNHAVEIDLVQGGEARGYLFDPYSGRPLRSAIPWDFWLVSKLLALHTELFGGESGRLVNGALGLCLAFMALTGVLVWKPKKRKAPSASTAKPPGNLRRLHMTVGIWAALFVFMWGITGASLVYPEVMMRTVDYFEPFDEMNPVERVGDVVSYWLAYLHFGRFGGYIPGCERGSGCDGALKATWSLIALAPAFLAGSGIVLWLRGRKARARVRRSSPSEPDENAQIA
jgi:uncharacterized iron-regulated membrane protein